MAGADAVTTLSVAMRDELVARGVPAEKIVIVPNGIDPAAFQPAEADPDLRRRYGLDDRWVFGYVSSMDSIREGHQLLIEADRAARRGRSARHVPARGRRNAAAAARGAGRRRGRPGIGGLRRSRGL